MSAAPRAHTPRSDLPTYGHRVAKVARAKGRPLMPWQQLAADVALEYRPETGFLRYPVVVVTVPRQSGKTDLEGSVADARCLWHKGQRVRITMQDGKTADEWMREQHFESLAATRFAGRYTTSKRAGMHGITWHHTRSTFNTFPPIRTALHSKQTDLGLVDEAWAHDAEAGRAIKQALGPTMATRDQHPPGPQLWVVSTEGDDTSEYLAEYIARGEVSLGDPDTEVCFIDYGIPEDADPEDLAVIAAHHPAVGNTITLRTLQLERENFRDPRTGVLDVAGYARAYGNRRSTVRVYVFPDGVWSAAGKPRQSVPDRAGLALDVTPDGARFALGAGWRDADDKGFVELIEAGPQRRDTFRLVAKAARSRNVPLHVDRQAQAALEVVDRFAELAERDRPEVEFLNTAQYGSACVAFHRGIFNRTIHHPNDPDLDAAVKVASQRNLPEGGWAWGRKGSAGSICELVSVTIALRAFDLLPAPATKPFIRVA